MKDFTHSPMGPVFEWLSGESRNLQPGKCVECLLMNPDHVSGTYTGFCMDDGRVTHAYQSLVDLAGIHGFRMLTPERVGEATVRIRFEKLDSEKFWPTKGSSYGTESEFSKIIKHEEPWFISSYSQSIRDAGISPGWRILFIGLNRGDELWFLKEQLGAEIFETLTVTGVEHHSAAVEKAKERFGECKNVHILNEDIQDFEELNLPRQDLIIAIDTLQSTGLNGKELIVHLRKKLLKHEGTLILGFPNTRYIDGALSYGARVRNYTEPEYSLLIRDLFFYRRYLQQQGFQVKITGKYTIFLTAVKTGT